MKVKFYYTLLLFLIVKAVLPQAPAANAGNDFTMCPGGVSQLGGSPTASGGTPPYRYNWTPTTGLSSPTASNPTVSITASTTYYLMVTDTADQVAFDTIRVTLDPIAQYGAGKDTAVCLGDSGAPIGSAANAGANGYTFSWQPTAGLNDPTAPNPVASPSTTTIYSLTVSDGICTLQTGTVVVGIRLLHFVADHDTTINEGETVTISASGADSYSWYPKNSYIKYDMNSSADVNPNSTTTYTVYGTDNKGCYGSDTLRVNVRPSDEPVFYSAFSPNGDGINDYFFIGNVAKYPDNLFKVYNRYGQVIFTSSGYNNDWDGSYQGNKVPTGTYFYIFDTGTDKGKYKGTVTILR